MADKKIGMQITLIKQHLARLLDKMLTDQGIHEFNGPQGRILYVLWNHDLISIQELAKETGLANTTLTSMLDRMEQKQLIRRTADSNDRRKYLIALTPKARSLEKKYRAVTDQMTELTYQRFTVSEITQLEELLERVLDNVRNAEMNQKK